MDLHDPIAQNSGALEISRATALAFARALDAGDLGAAGELLAPECEFVEGTTRLKGDGAIMAQLRDATMWAERGFDDLRPATTVESVALGSALLSTTIAWMRVPGRWHRLRFERGIEVRADGRIARITQGCEPVAARAFTVFAKDSGAPPPPPGFGIIGEG